MLVTVPGEVEDAGNNRPGSKFRGDPQPHSPSHNSDPGAHSCHLARTPPGQAVCPEAWGPREGLHPHPSSPRVVLKGVLGALAVVDVPVNNEDPGGTQHGTHRRAGPPLQARSPAQDGKGLGGAPHLRPAQHSPVQPVLLLGMSGRDGHIIEHAESVGSSPLAVVPRRPEGEGGAWGLSRSSSAHTWGQPGERDGSHLTRASPLCTAPVSTASTSCSPAPAASRALWKVLCGAEVQVSLRRLPLRLCPHLRQAAGH